MNYTYDIFLNFNKTYYDFFEWNNNDLFIHFKKIPVIKVNHKTLGDVMTYKINFKTTLNTESEIYSKKGIIKRNNYFIIADDKNAIGVEIDNNLNIINLSSLVPDEEMDAIDAGKKIKIVKLDYSKENKKIKNKFKTRQTIEKEKYIKNKLQNIYNKKEYDLLEYIYYECNGKELDNTKIKDFLNKDIDKLYNILKIINI